MKHVRAQIRDAVVSVLTGLVTTGSRVYSGRSRALAVDHDPALLVYATEETSDVDAMGGMLRRELTLVVEGRAVEVSAVAIEETLDQIAAEVEAAMMIDPSLGGRTREVTLVREVIVVQSPGESHAGEVRMEFRVVYRTRESDPTQVTP